MNIKKIILGLGSGFICLGTSLIGISCSPSYKSKFIPTKVFENLSVSNFIDLDKEDVENAKNKITSQWVFNNRKNIFSGGFANDLTVNKISVNNPKADLANGILSFEVVFAQNSLYVDLHKTNDKPVNFNVEIKGFSYTKTPVKVNTNLSRTTFVGKAALDKFAGFAAKYEINRDWVFDSRSTIFTGIFAPDINRESLSISSINLVGQDKELLSFVVTFKQNSIFDETGKLNIVDKKFSVTISGFDPNPTSYINPNITKEDLGFASDTTAVEVSWIDSYRLVQHYNKIFNCKVDSKNIGTHSLIPSGKASISADKKIVNVQISVGPGIIYDFNTWQKINEGKSFTIRIMV